LVGVGGLVAAAWGSSRERRWQTREERATELRTVLEGAGERLSTLLLAIDEAHREARQKPINNDRHQELLAMQQQLVVAGKRIGVRRGSKSDEYVTFGACFLAMSAIATIVEEAETKLDREQERAYSSAWTLALTAEEAFLDATAKALALEGPLPRRRKLLDRSG
jgi:hypothetical protein